MPEIAEVERGRRLLENAILGKKIISVATQEDAIVFVDDSASILETALPDRTVLAVSRRGKNVYLKLDGDGPTLAFHLGMTGSVAIKDGEFHYRRPRYIKRISASWPPWRWKILLRMDDETEVCTIDTSRFGRVRAVNAEDAVSVPPLSLLARDAYLDLPTTAELGVELKSRTAPIKTVLLDQNAVVSGLGNYNVDEVLFQARIHPRQPAYTLDEEQMEALHEAVGLVVAKVMEIDADTKKLPKTWLYKHRYGRKNGVGKVFVMEDGKSTQVTHDRINARITAITDVQVLGNYSDVPLPKKRKHTVVDPEEGGEDAAGEDEASVNGEQHDCEQLRPKRRRTTRRNKSQQIAMHLVDTSPVVAKVLPIRTSKRRRTTEDASEERKLIQTVTDNLRRCSARLREKHGLP